MEKLAMSSQPQTASWSGSERLTNDRAAYATERARVLFGCFRKGDANDPDTYVAAIAAVLADYPEDTIWSVTDPRSGVASKVGFLPTVKEIRDACEDHYGPTRRAIEREGRERRQLAERKALAPPDEGPRPTYDELIARCRADGLHIGGCNSEPFDVKAFKEKYQISEEAWNAIPSLERR